MANTAPKKHTAGFTLRVDPDFQQMLEDLLLFEAQQGNRLTKSDMIRRLVTEAWHVARIERIERMEADADPLPTRSRKK